MEMTREQVEKNVDECCGQIDIENYRQVRAARQAILAHDQAQRERIDKLEEALRLNLGVGPDDPILLTPIEREVVELREKLAAVTRVSQEYVDELAAAQAQLTAQAAALAAYEEDMKAARGELGVSLEESPIGSLVSKLVMANRVLRSERSTLQRQLADAQRTIKEHQDEACAEKLHQAQATIARLETRDKDREALLKALKECPDPHHAIGIADQLIGEKVMQLQQAHATIQRLEDRNALLEEYQKACHGMEDNIQRGIDENEALQQRLATVEAALKEADHELDRIQWVRGADCFTHLAEFRSCPSCGFGEHRGHPEGCNLDRVRKQTAKALAPAPGGQERQEEMMIEVYVVKYHNATSGKGSYGLAGVFWTKADAEKFVADPDRQAAARGWKVYSIHRFVEDTGAQPGGEG